MSFDQDHPDSSLSTHVYVRIYNILLWIPVGIEILSSCQELLKESTHCSKQLF